MSDRHLKHWPARLSQHLSVPATSLYFNVEVAAARYADKPFLVYYDTILTFARFKEDCDRLAGYLQKACGVKKGDRVLLYMQNSPQFILAYYAILRADAVVVPVNPMNRTAELRHYVDDASATVAITAQDIYPNLSSLLGAGLQHVVVATYSDYLKATTDLTVPDFVAAPRRFAAASGAVAWGDALARGLMPEPSRAGPNDLAVMPYTSGTTGNPKGCMHTHRSTMYNAVSGAVWGAGNADNVVLSVLPYFHVTGMQSGMNVPLYTGATVVLLTRWDRETAAKCIERYRITGLAMITTMVIDFLANPNLKKYDLSSVRRWGGGGAAMPEALAEKLKNEWGLDYLEGYGMSETMAATHMNPSERPKKQCLGMPIFDVDARVVDPATFGELGVDEVGEIVVNGPQVMQGYWNNPEATAASFVEIDGKRFLRTGDLARCDEDGYFFMVDRLKRMINASGYKVWPAEVEALLYAHPAIQEACVIGAADPRRGETVKALVVLREAYRGKVSAEDIVAWAHDNMAAYKSPRIVDIVEELPKSATGKVQWRALQEEQKGP